MALNFRFVAIHCNLWNTQFIIRQTIAITPNGTKNVKSNNRFVDSKTNNAQVTRANKMTHNKTHKHTGIN